MDPPSDGDELARVVPLRRRDRELTAAPGARGSLPRERAPFDPEIEPHDISSADGAVALQVRRPALRLGRRPRRRDDRPAAGSRRRSPTVLLASAAGAGLAMIAVVALAASLLNQSPPAPTAQLGSLERGAAADPLARTGTGVLSATSDPLGVTGHAALREARTRGVMQSHRTPPKSGKVRPAHHGAPGRALSSKHQSAVVASYTPDTSATTGHTVAPDTQTPATTYSTPASVSTPTSDQSSSGPSTASSSSGSTNNRPAFGEQGLLGPGSSPDS